MKRFLRLATVQLAAVLLLAAAWKTLFFFWDVIPFNSDEAIVALMARHILQGERPVFFYGQAYMGSLDAFLVAAGFLIFGQKIWVIRLVQLLLYLGTLLTTCFIGKTAFDSPRAGVLAALLLAIPTVNVTLYTTATLGGYGEALLIGNLILLVALLLARRMKTPPPARFPWPGFAAWGAAAWGAAAWGALAGCGLWANGLTLVYSAPAGIYLLWNLWKCRRDWLAGFVPAAAAGFFLGSLPWWLYAAANGPGRLVVELLGSAVAVERVPWLARTAAHLVNFLLLGLTVIFGFRPPWSVTWLGLPLLPFALVFWAAVIWFFARKLVGPRRGGSVQLPKTASGGRGGSVQLPITAPEGRGGSVQLPITAPEGRGGSVQLPITAPEGRGGSVQLPITAPEGRGEYALLAGVIGTLLAGFLFTAFGVDPSGRYFLPLAVPLALVAAQLILGVPRRAWQSAGLVVLVIAYQLWGAVQCALNDPPGLTTQFYEPSIIDHRADAGLIAFLRGQGETRGYSNYWVAYPLAFRSGEDLLFVPRLPYHLDLRYTPRDDRYAPYDAQVAQSQRVAYITTRNPDLDRYLRDHFKGLGLAWREKQIGDYRVYYHLSRPVRPQEIGLGELRE